VLPLWNPGNKTSRYFIPLIPVISILVASFIADFFAIIKNTFREKMSLHRLGAILIVTTISIYAVNQAGGNAYILWKHRGNDYYSFIAELKAAIPKNSKIWGATTFWLGLNEYDYVTQTTPFEEIKRFKPDYVLLYDSGLWGGASSTVGRKDNTKKAYKEIRENMERVRLENGTLVKTLKNKFYGDVHIYKVEWNESK
jgi:hypothetical protein